MIFSLFIDACIQNIFAVDPVLATNDGDFIGILDTTEPFVDSRVDHMYVPGINVVMSQNVVLRKLRNSYDVVR